ncbi:unnamed protein product [Mytilus edulis]|uniref:Ig-like domain-containing protein n=1 Tax=Mytilus edulis TaxID=6550 RepID=A0A8S3URT3_MYTED|nr:unnamed protein product [Mytilus edulis]
MRTHLKYCHMNGIKTLHRYLQVVHTSYLQFKETFTEFIRALLENTVGPSESSQVLQLNVLYGVTIDQISLKRPHEGQQLTVECRISSNPNVTENRPTVVLVPVHNPYDVPENSSNVQLTCNVTSTNPNVTSFKWFKDGSKLLITDRTFTMAKVNRTNSGYYTCDATNSVGTSMNATVLELNVLCKFFILIHNYAVVQLCTPNLHANFVYVLQRR